MLFKKTRAAGAAVLISYVCVFLFGQYFLKNLVSRPRPCQIDQSFALFVHFPTDVLAGAVFGVIMGILAVKLYRWIESRYKGMDAQSL